MGASVGYPTELGAVPPVARRARPPLAGVSLVLAYRESFASIVRTSGIDGLIRMLEDKNRQNEPAARASDATKLVPLLLIHGASRASQP